MARAQSTGRRGSPEAVAKRRAARTLNSLFARTRSAGTLDGRTLKRKNRLMKELKYGKGGAVLKAHEALSHLTELLALGEPMAAIRKLNPKVPGAPMLTDEAIAIIRETQESYGFDPRAWSLLGVDIHAIMGMKQPTSPERIRRKADRRKAAS